MKINEKLFPLQSKHGQSQCLLVSISKGHICNTGLWFSFALHIILSNNIIVKFHEDISNDFQAIEQTQVFVADTSSFKIQRAITTKVGEQELSFLCSACRLMMGYICT